MRIINKMVKKQVVPTNNNGALREEKWGLQIKSYPFGHICSSCGHRDMVTNDGKMFVTTFPMGSTKKAVGDGSKKKRVVAQQTELKNEELW